MELLEQDTCYSIAVMMKERSDVLRSGQSIRNPSYFAGWDQQTISNDAFMCKQSRLLSLLSKDPAGLVSLAVGIPCIFDY